MPLSKEQVEIMMTEAGQKAIQTLEGLVTGKLRLKVVATPVAKVVKDERFLLDQSATQIVTDYTFIVEPTND